MPFAQVANVLFVNRAALARVYFAIVGLRAVAQPHLRKAAAQIDDHAAAQPKLDTGKGVVGMNGIGHHPVRGDIIVVP